MLARTPAQVVAAEAAYQGGDETRFNDMLGIASVIANRAIMTGASPQDIVGLTSQFNAYNKPMPAGAQHYVDMAQQAIDDVEQNGPVNDASYFATPAALGNLPGGLTQVDQVDQGHVYFSDPLNRPIKTKIGVLAMDPAALDTRISTMASAYADDTQAAADSFDASRFGDEAAAADFDAGRFGDPAANTADFDASRFGDAPAAGFDAGRFGASDLGMQSVTNPMGAVASAEMGASPDLGAMAAAAAMSPDSVADRMGVTDANSQKTDRLPGMATSVDPSRFGDVTASDFDASRMGAMDPAAAMNASIANTVASNPAMGVDVSATGSIGGAMPGASAVVDATQSAPTDAQATSSVSPGLNTPEGMKAQYSAYGAGQIDPAEAAAQAFNNEVLSTKVARPTVIDAENAVPGITDDVAPAIATEEVTGPVSAITASFAANPTVTAAAANKSLMSSLPSAGKVWSGEATTGIATDGSTVSRLADGSVARYNPKFDQTEYTGPTGTFSKLEPGNTITAAKPAPESATPDASKSLSSPSLSSAPSSFADSLFSGGTLGALAGALGGSVIGGPVGGALGAAAGRKLGGRFLGDGVQDQSPMKSLFSIFAPAVSVDANGFPSAPSTGLFGGLFGGGAGGGLNDYGKQVAGDSKQFGDAVDSGTGGLW
jgi:hypothetical protein